MGHEVQQEEAHEDGEEQGSQRVTQGRHKDEEHGCCEDEKREPARDLLGVQGKLETVQTPPLPVLRGGQARVGRAYSQHSPAITDTCRSRRSRLATDYNAATILPILSTNRLSTQTVETTLSIETIVSLVIL